jgi:PAS domain S-box-containing protein
MIAWMGIWAASFLGIAAVSWSVWQAFGPSDDNTANSSAAMYTLLDTGRVLEGEITRAVDPAIARTQMLATSADVIKTLASGDVAAQTALLNSKITSATEIDAIALFNSTGRITAINTRYADGQPIPKERLESVLETDFSQVPIIRGCLRNNSIVPVLEFQTHCNITPAFFGSSGLSVAYSVPILNPRNGTKLGVISSRMRFERLSSLIENATIAGGAAKAFFITDGGGYFSEAINRGQQQPPVPVAELRDIIRPILSDAISKTVIKRGDKYLSIFSLPSVQTLEGSGIHILIVADSHWLTQDLRQERWMRAAGTALLGVPFFIIAALFGARLSTIRTSRKIDEANARLSGVLTGALDGVMAFESVRDQAGEIINFRWLLTNPAAERIVGKTNEELAGRLLLDMFPGSRDEGLYGAYIKVVESGQPLHHEQYYGRDGLALWLEISAVKLGDGFSLTFADVTARKLAEEQLKAAKEAAEMATRAKSELLANMSHEIRTPITAMVGFADMMLDPDQSQSDRVDGLQTIRRNAKHLLDLINEILDLSKIEAGRMTVESLPTDLAPLLSDVMSIMRPRALEKRIELSLRFANKIPKSIVTDPVRTKQILMNLVSNALKFTEHGKVEILVSCDPSAQALNLSVTDTGIGISSEQMSRLFQPFMQADGSMTRRFGGTGLGLTISKRLAQMLGGDITVQSEAGVGSTFTARIAGAGDGSGAYCTVEDAMVAPQVDAELVFEKISGRVLLAEDGKDNQRFIAAMLRKAGAEVVIAENGRIAVEKARAENFDLILMDMQMPELDGYAATSRLRRSGYAQPIIALTAHAMADDRAKCLQAGCTEYLVKPIDRRLLVQTVARCVKAGQATPVKPPATPVPASQQPTEIVSTFDSDPVMAEVLPEFIANLPEQVASLKQLFDEKNLAGLQEAVHQLKGAGGSYGFEGLTNVAAIAESSIKTGATIETIKSQVESLIRFIESVRGFRSALEIPNVR